MTEIYPLRFPFSPFPNPHDCVIREILLDGNELSLVFEDDLSRHESIQNQHPEARSLIMRFHLCDADDFQVYKRRSGLFKGYRAIRRDMVLGRQRQLVEYLSHSFSVFRFIIQTEPYIFCIDAPEVEYQWIER